MKKVSVSSHFLYLAFAVILLLLLWREHQLQRLQAIRLENLERQALRNSRLATQQQSVISTKEDPPSITNNNDKPVVFKVDLAAKRYPTIHQFVSNSTAVVVGAKGGYGGILYEVVSTQFPRALRLYKLLSAEDCKAIIEFARPQMARNMVVGDKMNSLISSVRTSNGMFIMSPLDADRRLRENAAKMVGVPLENCEATQVLKYEAGQFYRPHPDYFGKGSPHLSRGGERFATVLTWLNGMPSGKGGETRFPYARPTVLTVQQTAVGDSVLFYSLTEDGVLDVCSTHEGVPPQEGVEKWVAVIWIRQQKFV